MKLITRQDFEYRTYRELIRGFDENQLTPMGYDFRAGACRNVTSGEETILEGEKVQLIYHGDFVTIETKESVNLSGRDDIFGLVFSKVSYTSKGLSHVGTKIDPGFVGKLRLSFENRGYEVFQITERTSICNVAFLQVPIGAGQEHFPAGTDYTHSSVERSVLRLPFPLKGDDSEQYRKWFSMEVLDAYVRLSEELEEFRGEVALSLKGSKDRTLKNLERLKGETGDDIERLRGEVAQNLLRAERIYSGAILTTFVAAIAVVSVLVAAGALFFNQLRVPNNSITLAIAGIAAAVVVFVCTLVLLAWILTRDRTK
jgi:deoxycytidine triphosphate deaminase